MPFILNNPNQIKRMDKSRIYKSIETFPDQIRQVLDEAHLIKVPYEYSKVNQVVVNGMGGSNLGAGIVKSAWSGEIKVPITILPGYEVPANVDSNTLYVISSYSGNTEEPLSVYRELKKRKVKVIAITARGRGKLERLMIKDNIPGYIFKPEYNPSLSPRLGLGYSIFGTAVLLAKAGLFKIKIGDMKDIVASLEIWDREFRLEIPAKYNKAKKLARELFNRIPIAVGAEFLIGNLRVLRNQFYENGKNFASYLVVPELNHYAMEGLANPQGNRQNLLFFFINSALYHPRIRRRMALTKIVVKKNRIKYIDIKLSSKNKLAQSFELLQLGTWASYYLGILNKSDPATNPWVDWFKKKLG
jgi:glucose/mannose-6-phosphate isomerase